MMSGYSQQMIGRIKIYIAIFVAIKEQKKIKNTTTKIPRQVINANEWRQSCESYLSSFAFSFWFCSGRNI